MTAPARDEKTGAALVACGVAVFAWGLGPLFVNAISASANTVIFWRMWLAQPLMIGIAYATGGALTWPLLKRSFPAGVCFAGSIIFGFTSFRETSIVNATLIPALLPAVVLLIAGKVFGEHRTRVEILLALVTMVGAAVVVAGASSDGSSLYGDLLAVANLILFGGYFLLSKHHRNQDVHSWSWIASVLLVAALCVTPWCLLTSHDLGGMVDLDWLWLVLLVVVPGFVGHGLMSWVHGHLDVTLSSLISLGNPVVSTVGAWVFFSQALSASQIVGVIVVLVALGALMTKQKGDIVLAGEAAATQDLLDAGGTAGPADS